ncbi:MAG TPA: hypothetical protein VGD43_23085, partial [Micromonospora sp.]
STAVIDSTYHSGRTLQSMAELVRSFDARIVAATVAVRSRIIGQVTGISPICPVHALHEVDVHAWRPDDCPNCRAGQPLDERPACWKEPR